MIVDYKIAVYCVYCEREFSPNSDNLIKTKDHIIPKILGGVNHPDNYTAACRSCNGLKGGRSLPEFADWLITTYNKGNGGYFNFSRFPQMHVNAYKLYNKTSKMHKKYLYNLKINLEV